jgi:hypothetical protein
MSSPKSGLETRTSSTKRRKTVHISTSIKNGHVLVIQRHTDYSIFLFVSTVLIGFSVLAFLFIEMPLEAACAPVILLVAHFLFKDRSIRCIVDKQRAQIDYLQAGLLGSSLFERSIHCDIASIKKLKMKKYYYRRGYGRGRPIKYQIILILDDGQKLPLSSKKLSRNYCKRFANKFGRFLGREIPIEGLD